LTVPRNPMQTQPCAGATRGTGIPLQPRGRNLDLELTDIGQLPDIERLPVVKVSIQSLSVSGSPRRSGENSRHVRTLAEAWGGLPPILVHFPAMRVIDGIHRLRAAQLRGEDEIEARLVEGDEGSSYVLAVKSNVTHGLPLSIADRKSAAARIIDLYPDWSDRMIASVAGIAPNTVASVRVLYTTEVRRPSGQDAHLDTRVGLDGRRRPRNAGERRELAARLIRENPGSSLREIAAQAGVSPETVRSVRSAGMESGVCDDERGETAVLRIRAPSAARQRQGRESSSGNGRKSSLNFLRADPAFRSTDSGRALLQLLAFPELVDRYGPMLLAQIPPHCLEGVAKAAAECAAEWKEFAAKIEATQSQVACPQSGERTPTPRMASREAERTFSGLRVASENLTT
jgi:ParB-like nuclease domain